MCVCVRMRAYAWVCVRVRARMYACGGRGRSRAPEGVKCKDRTSLSSK